MIFEFFLFIAELVLVFLLLQLVELLIKFLQFEGKELIIRNFLSIRGCFIPLLSSFFAVISGDLSAEILSEQYIH